MTDRTGETTARLAKRLAERTARGARYFDLVLLAAAAGFVLLALADAPQVPASALFTLESLVEILPFLVASVVIAAGARATGFDRQIAAVFSGHPVKAILLAAAFGALSPFCSCGVIPIIAALLGVGVPLAPVMAFWLASPLMDPEMFLLMLGVFGLEFTLAKAASALALGLLGGFATYFLARAGGFAEPLRGPAVRPARPRSNPPPPPLLARTRAASCGPSGANPSGGTGSSRARAKSASSCSSGCFWPSSPRA